MSDRIIKYFQYFAALGLCQLALCTLCYGCYAADARLRTLLSDTRDDHESITLRKAFINPENTDLIYGENQTAIPTQTPIDLEDNKFKDHAFPCMKNAVEYFRVCEEEECVIQSLEREQTAKRGEYIMYTKVTKIFNGEAVTGEFEWNVAPAKFAKMKQTLKDWVPPIAADENGEGEKPGYYGRAWAMEDQLRICMQMANPFKWRAGWMKDEDASNENNGGDYIVQVAKGDYLGIEKSEWERTYIAQPKGIDQNDLFQQFRQDQELTDNWMTDTFFEEIIDMIIRHKFTSSWDRNEKRDMNTKPTSDHRDRIYRNIRKGVIESIKSSVTVKHAVNGYLQLWHGPGDNEQEMDKQQMAIPSKDELEKIQSNARDMRNKLKMA